MMMTLEQRVKLLTAPTHKVDIVLDTDAFNEIDDQFAISYALKSKEAISVQALYAAPFLNKRSVSPLDGMEKSYHEILKLLALSGEKTDVFRGAGAYLCDEQTPIRSAAAMDLSQRAMEYTPENPLYIVAIGAITNIASAFLLNPGIAERTVVVWLGGNSLDWPNSKEFNLAQDVAAARVVFDSGVPLVMLPCMGVVNAFASTGPELAYWLEGKGELPTYLWRQTVKEANSYAADKPWSRPIWDVTTVGWLMNHDQRLMLQRLETTPIPQYDHHYSRDPLRPLCTYVYHINRDALMLDLFQKVTL